MTEQELLQMRDLAETGQVQFKERINDRYDIGCGKPPTFLLGSF